MQNADFETFRYEFCYIYMYKRTITERLRRVVNQGNRREKLHAKEKQGDGRGKIRRQT